MLAAADSLVREKELNAAECFVLFATRTLFLKAQASKCYSVQKAMSEDHLH